jgi:hypothetical protein
MPEGRDSNFEAPAKRNFEGDVARLETAHRVRSVSQFTKQLNQKPLS